MVTTSGENVMEDKLVVAVAGHPELYDFINRSCRDINRKQQTWRQISAKIMVRLRTGDSVVA